MGALLLSHTKKKKKGRKEERKKGKACYRNSRQVLEIQPALGWLAALTK
jgi:hypothetical protein